MSSVRSKLLEFEARYRKAADHIKEAAELVPDTDPGPEGVFGFTFPSKPVVDPTKKIDGRSWVVCQRPSCHGVRHRANHPHIQVKKAA